MGAEKIQRGSKENVGKGSQIAGNMATEMKGNRERVARVSELMMVCAEGLLAPNHSHSFARTVLSWSY